MRMKFATIILIAIIVVVIVSVSYNANKPVESQKISESVQVAEPGKVVIYVPAVDSKGNGVVGKFEVQAMPGSGKTLTNIEHILFFVDTQFSIQISKSVAANITGIDISKYNLIYDIDTEVDDARVVEGPSAGAALTVATVAALQNEELSSDVMITGTINPDGTIGKVGNIATKAKAAKLGGAKVLLVPQGQGIGQSFKVESTCEQVGRFKVCKTAYKQQPTIGSTEDGVVIKEVQNIEEALKYFLQ